MTIQSNGIIFNLPSFFVSPIFLLIVGAVIGAIIAYFLIPKEDSDKNISNFDSKSSVLGNIAPSQIMSRSRSVIEMVRIFNKILSLMNTHKPVISIPITRINSSANEGLKVILYSERDFYELIGGWSSLQQQLTAILENIEHYSKNSAIANEIYRAELKDEINKGKEILSRSVS